MITAGIDRCINTFDWRLTCVSFGHPLALNLVELKFDHTQVDASFSPFGHRQPNAT